MAGKKKRRSKENFPFSVEGIEPLECHLMEQREYMLTKDSGYGGETDETRHGKYHGSMFWQVENFGKKKWVVCVNIALNWQILLAAGMSEEEIVKRCIAYLNLPPKRKKFQRRHKAPLYGKLSPVPVWTRLKEESGQQFISAVIVTDKRRCKKFWNEGVSIT